MAERERERRRPLGGEEREWGVEEVGWSERARRKQVCFGSFSGAVGGEAVASERKDECKESKQERERERQEYLVCIRKGSCIRLDVYTYPFELAATRRETEEGK